MKNTYIALFLLLGVCFAASDYTESDLTDGYSSSEDISSSDDHLSDSDSDEGLFDANHPGCVKAAQKQTNRPDALKWSYCDESKKKMVLCTSTGGLFPRVSGSSVSCPWGCDTKTERCVDVKPTPTALPKVWDDGDCRGKHLERYFCLDKERVGVCVKECGVEGIEATCGKKLKTSECIEYTSDRKPVNTGCRQVNQFQIRCGPYYRTNSVCPKDYVGALCTDVKRMKSRKSYVVNKKAVVMCSEDGKSREINIDCERCSTYKNSIECEYENQHSRSYNPPTIKIYYDVKTGKETARYFRKAGESIWQQNLY